MVQTAYAYASNERQRPIPLLRIPSDDHRCRANPTVVLIHAPVELTAVTMSWLLASTCPRCFRHLQIRSQPILPFSGTGLRNYWLGVDRREEWSPASVNRACSSLSTRPRTLGVQW